MNTNKKRLFIIGLIIMTALITVRFSMPAKEGDVNQLGEIDDRLYAENSQNFVEIYFSNNRLDPEISCFKVFPVLRSVGSGKLNLRQILEVLLQGLTEKEKEDGYFTSIPENVKINSLEQEDNFVKIDFNKEMGIDVAGSCRVTAIRAQIVKTVLVYDKSIRSVVISIDGEVEGALQP